VPAKIGAMLRVLHFSDIHVGVPLRRMPKGELLGKRLIGGANLVLRRAAHFRKARAKLQRLARFAERERVDLCVCTGDYTALGTEPELRAAREAVADLTRRPLGMVTVPGNHDLYLRDTLVDGRFERLFGDLLRSDWPELCVDGPWPSVRLAGEQLAVISVNSARPNPQPWRSSGRIPEAQLAGLRRALDDERLRGRSVLVATHYAPRRPDGSPDRFTHGLENADELLSVCADARRTAMRLAILHGHIHARYHIRLPAGGVRLFGAGSATHEGHESFWLFEVDADGIRALPGRLAGDDYELDPSAAVLF
jgi:3',5'-cyclic AMP phosphodiesterase CpdA